MCPWISHRGDHKKNKGRHAYKKRERVTTIGIAKTKTHINQQRKKTKKKLQETTWQRETRLKRDFKISRRRVWSSELSSGMYCRVKWLSTDVSEVRTASIIRIVFWDVLPCKMIVDRRFRDAYCLHHQGWVNSLALLKTLAGCNVRSVAMFWKQSHLYFSETVLCERQ
jgi:hypothetical protein